MVIEPTTKKPNVTSDTLDVTIPAVSPATLLPNGANPFTFRIDLSEITQYANDSDVSATNVVGFKSGTLDGFEVGADGVITATFSNNQKSALGRIGIAKFKNPAGLTKASGNLFTVTPNSGQPILDRKSVV